MSDPVVTFDEKAVCGELGKLVRRTVEDTLNVLLEKEANDPIGASRYEQASDREAYRTGYYERSSTVISDQVTPKIPKLKGMRSATAIIKRCKRRETSAEEPMIEIYLAGGSTRKAEDVSEILWCAQARHPSEASNLDYKAFEASEGWRGGPLTREYPYVFVGDIRLERVRGALA